MKGRNWVGMEKRCCVRGNVVCGYVQCADWGGSGGAVVVRFCNPRDFVYLFYRILIQ